MELFEGGAERQAKEVEKLFNCDNLNKKAVWGKLKDKMLGNEHVQGNLSAMLEKQRFLKER